MFINNTYMLICRCISAGVPKIPEPVHDPSWLQNRRFITSARGPSSKAAAGGARRTQQAKDDDDDDDEGIAAASGQRDSARDALTDPAGGDSSGGPPVVMLAEEILQEEDLAADPGIALIPDVSFSDVGAMDAAELLKLCRQVSEALGALHVQTHIDGMNNIWIVKPAALSRGRGIRLFNDLDKLFSYIKGDTVDLDSLDLNTGSSMDPHSPLSIGGDILPNNR